ncbi:MAG TPA: hypothetical protein VD815_00320 [Candidatus Saccharimonadales bacterium]|nr:hypothetical protein [Candidatus Saccharimonadales bacterium]
MSKLKPTHRKSKEPWTIFGMLTLAMLSISLVIVMGVSHPLLQEVDAKKYHLDLPLKTKECKLDTNPYGPSCKPDIQSSAIVRFR